VPTADADSLGEAVLVAAGEIVGRRLGVEVGVVEALWRALIDASRVMVCETEDTEVDVTVMTLDRDTSDENVWAAGVGVDTLLPQAVDESDETADADFEGETGEDADSRLVGASDAVDACDAFDDALACALGEAAPVLISDDDRSPLRVASLENTADPLVSDVIVAPTVGKAVRESWADFVTLELSETHDDCDA
jgi:hypothetical protein